MTIYQALAAVMEDVRAVKKGDRNQSQGYQFRGIDATVNAVGPVLRKHGVVVVPMLEDVTYRDVLTSTGKASRECTVKVRYRFYGPEGDFVDCVTPGESMDSGDKGAPKAMSVAFRIALLQALCLPTDEKDPDADSYERGVIGRGEPPADTPTAARKALAAEAEKCGLKLDEVSAAYKAKTGRELRTEKDAASIRFFCSSLLEEVTEYLAKQEQP